MVEKTLIIALFLALLVISFKIINVVLSKEAKINNRSLLIDRVKGAIIGVCFWVLFVYIPYVAG
jgi:hypothetical protein